MALLPCYASKATLLAFTPEARQGAAVHAGVMRTIGNILWFVLAGWWLALAVNRGSAADLLGLSLDAEVRIKSA